MNSPEVSPIVVKRPSLIILSDNSEFVDGTVTRWKMDRLAPHINVGSLNGWHSSLASANDLIVIGPIDLNASPAIPSVLKEAAGKPVICVVSEQSRTRALTISHPNLVVLEQRDDWVRHLIVLGNEILRRTEALGRAHRAEKFASESQRYAALGRYMLDMRPGVNDALTSILGNADLLLLDPPQDDQDVREQIKTIHRMSLRLNEIMQRFSSLATEMQTATEDISSRLTPATAPTRKAHSTN